jgi:hypothetical protein
MLELIAIVGGLFLLFYLPQETNKVRNGCVRPVAFGQRSRIAQQSA